MHTPPPLSVEKAKEIEYRFWPKVKIRGPDECWLWRAKAKIRGYGQIFAWGRPQYAHRIAYALGKGPLALGDHVLHKCDVPLCCNPHHLFIGDQRINMQDRYAKGRVRVRRAA